MALLHPRQTARRNGNLKAGNCVDRHTRFLRFDPTQWRGQVWVQSGVTAADCSISCQTLCVCIPSAATLREFYLLTNSDCSIAKMVTCRLSPLV